MQPHAVKVRLAAAAAGLLGLGCATYTAVKIPGPVADETVALGAHRRDVEGALGTSPESEYRDGDGITARYRYQDGPPEASKGRVVLYLAGDVFTLFLSELVFWPIEAYASRQTERVATARYDAGNELVAWSVDRSSGERLVSLGIPVPGGHAAGVPAAAAEPAKRRTAGKPSAR